VQHPADAAAAQGSLLLAAHWQDRHLLLSVSHRSSNMAACAAILSKVSDRPLQKSAVSDARCLLLHSPMKQMLLKPAKPCVQSLVVESCTKSGQIYPQTVTKRVSGWRLSWCKSSPKSAVHNSRCHFQAWVTDLSTGCGPVGEIPPGSPAPKIESKLPRAAAETQNVLMNPLPLISIPPTRGFSPTSGACASAFKL
jgi:hypothetical protein